MIFNFVKIYIYINVSYTHVLYNQSRFPNDNSKHGYRFFAPTLSNIRVARTSSFLLQVGRVQAHLFAKVLRIMIAWYVTCSEAKVCQDSAR